ncbi:MAG: hypothetical protein LBQ54_12230 [Planctomycetaceae bacterium]|jgi:hypothetical protein|nr:hypothetical protein [Planctomycetaceae bacterium]
MSENEKKDVPQNRDRRKVLGQILLGGTAAAAAGKFLSQEEKILAAKLTQKNDSSDIGPDGLASASRKHTNWAKFADLKKPVNYGTIKEEKISRLFLGGNLIGGWAHARDLLYASQLVLAYHTRDKIFATFKLAEACGINVHLGHHSQIAVMNDYWDKASGTLKYIADCSTLEGAVECADRGAVACYIQGATNDRLVREKKWDFIRKFLGEIRDLGILAGLGGHDISTIQGCVDHDLIPDFWMKTIHHDRYWSRCQGKEECDNVFCREPEETIACMAQLEQPWIGFKVLAAGAIPPADGFRYALEGGADFLCVGMYDFQVVDDVNIFMDIYDSGLSHRKRPWR